MLEQINYNSAALDAELKWLEEVINVRFDLHLGVNTLRRSVYECTAPDLDRSNSSGLARMVNMLNLGFEERIVLILAAAPYVRPQSLDMFFTRNKHDRTFTEVGGLKGRYHSGFLPTVETALFLLAGKDISKRTQLLDLISPNHPFSKLNILRTHHIESREPIFSAAIELTPEFFTFLTSGKQFKPFHTDNFPASEIKTKMGWSDLFLEDETINSLSQISGWTQHEQFLRVNLNMDKYLKEGCKAVFYGPSGTGKTLAAGVLGKMLNKSVYKVDTSQMVSKWVGETSKNIANLFNTAQNKDWILFFDEAESLFSTRNADATTNTSYRNQEIGYMLERIELYNGLVILSTNFIENVDKAFMRRFQYLVHFPIPSASTRLKIWQAMFQVGFPLSQEVNLEQIAANYSVTGAHINNILRDVNLAVARSNEKVISLTLLVNCIEQELKKSEKNQGKIGF